MYFLKQILSFDVSIPNAGVTSELGKAVPGHRYLQNNRTISRFYMLAPNLLPPSTPDFSGEVGLNLSLAWLFPVAVVKLHDGDLHAVGWGKGP